MDPTTERAEPENEDNEDSSDDEEDGKNIDISGMAAGDAPVGQKRKREKSSTSWVTMKTVFRWKQTGSVNVEHLLGCCDGTTAAELSKAQEILDTSGQLVCVLCNIPISANKKCVKRHQTKNRKHLNFLLDLANGNKVLNLANTMVVAANIPVAALVAKSPGAPATPLANSSGNPATGVSLFVKKNFSNICNRFVSHLLLLQ